MCVHLIVFVHVRICMYESMCACVGVSMYLPAKYILKKLIPKAYVRPYAFVQNYYTIKYSNTTPIRKVQRIVARHSIKASLNKDRADTEAVANTTLT